MLSFSSFPFFWKKKKKKWVKFYFHLSTNIQSTLVISRFKGLSEILRDICTSTYQNCKVEINRRTTFHKYEIFLTWICNLTPEDRDILKILWNRGEIAPYEQFFLFSTIFCYLLLDIPVKTRTRLSLRDKRLFEKTSVDCIWRTIFTLHIRTNMPEWNMSSFRLIFSLAVSSGSTEFAIQPVFFRHFISLSLKIFWFKVLDNFGKELKFPNTLGNYGIPCWQMSGRQTSYVSIVSENRDWSFDICNELMEPFRMNDAYSKSSLLLPAIRNSITCPKFV